MMKKFISALLVIMMLVSMFPATVFAAENATLSFANKAQRTSFSTSAQVWQQNGITFTNNKAASTSAVADYASPVRLYANSEIIVEHTSNMTQIVFDCNSSSYATALKESIGTTASVSVSSDKVTVTVAPAAQSFKIEKLTAQVRMDSITVTYEVGGSGGSTECAHTSVVDVAAVAATCTQSGYTAGKQCTECEAYTEGHEVIPATGHTMQDWNVVDAATCTEAGERNRGCANCDLVETEAIAALGHDYDENGTCGTCGNVAVMSQYELVTSADDLQVGDKLIVVGANESGDSYVMIPYASGNNLKAEAIDAPADGVIVLPDTSAAAVVILGTTDAGWTLFDGAKYLYSAGSTKNNYLKGVASLPDDNTGAWTITIEEGVATIVNVGNTGEGARNVIKFNYSNGNLFSNYKLDYVTKAELVSLYKLVEAEEPGEVCDHVGYGTVDGDDAIAPTCTTVGQTASQLCANCGAVVAEPVELPVSHEGYETYTEGYIAPTCTEPGETGTTYCSNCDEVVVENEAISATGHNFEEGVCTNCGDQLASGVIVEATITFDNKAKRTVYSTEQQVWTENSVVVTNDKGASTTNVGDYAKPARFYKSSTLTITFHSPMTQIVFDCNSGDYATALANSITEGTVTTDADKVTVVLDAPATSFVIASLTGGQVRMDSLTIAYEQAAGACLHETTEVQGYVAPTCTTEGATGDTVCTECGEVVTESVVLPIIAHTYDAAGNCTGCDATAPIATLMTELPKTNDVVIIYNITGFAMSDKASGNKLGAVAAAPADNKLVASDDMGQFVIRALGNNQYAFVIGEKFLTSGETGNSLTFAAELTECGKWTFEAEGTTAGTYYIRNVGAIYNGSNNQALEYYSGFTTYTFKTTDAYKMQMYFVKAIQCEHPSSTQQDDAVAPTCVAVGYTASTTCDICGAVTVEPEIVPATGVHTYENEACTVCNRVDPAAAHVAGLVAAKPNAGDKIVIYSNGYILTATAAGKKLAGVPSDAPVNGKLPYNAQVAVLTVSVDADGYYTFANESGAYLTSGETGNSLTFAAELTDYAKWSLAAAPNGSWYISNKSAVYNNQVQALEYFGGFTAYGIQNNEKYEMMLFNTNMITLTADVTEEIATEGNLYLDLNGFNAGYVSSDKIYAWDSSATATTAGTGKLTTESIVIADTKVGDVRYIALKDDEGVYTFHALELKLTAVTLRTNKAGIYYKAEMACDEVLKAAIESHGIAVSIMGMPTADFANEENTAATKILGAPESVFTSGSITNIFRAGLSAEKNAARGEMSIYANPYIQLADGTVLMGNNNAQKSLKDVMDYLNTNYATLKAEEQENVKAFYTAWAEDMASWNLENLAAAIVPTVPEEEEQA